MSGAVLMSSGEVLEHFNEHHSNQRTSSELKNLQMMSCGGVFLAVSLKFTIILWCC